MSYQKYLILAFVEIALHFVCFLHHTQAQTYSEVRTFTMAEGLPSNHIYDLVEDNEGFLWIATDNGVSRFDGRYFTNFTVKDGLPSYDAIQIAKDGQGKIWVNCYQQNPVYFDKLNNKFIKIAEYATNKAMSQSTLFIYNTKAGIIEFQNSAGKWFYKNQKLIDFTEPLQFKTLEGETFILKSNISNNRAKVAHQIDFTHNENKNYTLNFNSQIPKTRFNYWDNQIYIFTYTHLFRISDFSSKHITFKKEQLNFEENISEYKLLETELHAKGTSGNIYIFDRQTFRLKHKIIAGIGSTNLVIDSQKNAWVGTLENGLKLYGQNKIRRLEFNNLEVNQNFLSIAANEKGEVYAGNFYGQILKVNPPKVFDVSSGSRTEWIRDIIFLKNKTIGFSEYSVFEDLKNKNKFTKTTFGIKSVKKHNDSLILLGTIRGLVGYGVLNKKFISLNSPPIRIHKIVKASDKIYYYIGANSLFQYDFTKNKSNEVFSVKPLSEIRFQNLAFAKDSSLWVSSEIGDLYVFKNKQLVLKIDKNQLPENISTLHSHKDQIWVGSKAGISIIKYTLGQKPTYSISNISKYDGLQANTINDLCSLGNTIYAATEKGIAVIADNININLSQIKPIITGMKVFEKDTTILNTYKLETEEKFVSIYLSGVDLSGHFKTMQYALNTTENWHDLSSNSLNLKLSKGYQKVFFRAINNNNNVGNIINEVGFDVKIPIYRTTGFYLFCFIFFTSLISFITYNRSLQIQKRKLDKQKSLEEQRLKITADLHDDIGSTLSSLQINSVIANHLMESKPTKAKEVLVKIEEQSRELSERIGDIIWSMKPGKNEFIDFETRIKNFTNNILGSTNIEIKIDIDPAINSLLNDITIRKNLIFIAKEAINNAAKYSKASHLSISATIQNQEIIMKIIDDGIGFEFGKTTGNGLKNIENRVKELKGKFTLNTSPSEGCAIEVKIHCPYI